MSAIRICSIEFSEIPFRRLRNMSIPLAKRITLIAGHNGTGKSTILAFLANGSGMSEKEHISYFNRAVQANFQEIIHLTENHDYVEEIDKKPFVKISYDISGKLLVKKGNVTRRGKYLFRVVPRNDPKNDFDHEGISFKSDAKVPLPTIYLGMTRMIPVGESNRLHVKKSNDTSMPEDDRDYIQKITNELIDTGRKSATYITHQSITHTKKVTKHADYAYDTRAISLGQDSLGSIITALASFRKLQREMGDRYPGGVLIVDELDAGFHPRTQTQLLRVLQREATTLGLQIIATTHSLVLIEAIISQNQHITNSKRLDQLHYIQDTRNPHICEEWTFENIRADMYLEAPKIGREKKPILIAYAEDDEAQFYAMRILRGARLRRFTQKTGVRLNILSMKMGHDDLLKLPKKDNHFKRVIIVVDADVDPRKIQTLPNVVKLPGSARKGENPTPELLIYRFIEDLVCNPDNHKASWAKLHLFRLSSDQLRDHLLNDSSVAINKRDSAKNWFTKRLQLITEWELVDLWISENLALVDQFVENLILAIKSIPPKDAPKGLVAPNSGHT